MAPFSLILASSMAKVMWSWCSMPLATRLNATWGRERPTLRSLGQDLPPSRPDRAKRQVLYLEEILRYDGEALCVVGDALEVGVLVQNIVVNVQEELEGVLVQEVDLEGRGDGHQAGARGMRCTVPRWAAPTVTCFRDSMVK